jgi:hypothetical protein
VAAESKLALKSPAYCALAATLNEEIGGYRPGNPALRIICFGPAAISDFSMQPRYLQKNRHEFFTP